MNFTRNSQPQKHLFHTDRQEKPVRLNKYVEGVTNWINHRTVPQRDMDSECLIRRINMFQGQGIQRGGPGDHGSIAKVHCVGLGLVSQVRQDVDTELDHITYLNETGGYQG